jgi:hypothetical protein
MSNANGTDNRLSYRERDVDETLDDHEKRITTLERAKLLGMGYILAKAPEIAATISGFAPF